MCTVSSVLSDSVRLYELQPARLHCGLLQARILGGAAVNSSGDLPNPGIEPSSVMSKLHWQAGSLSLGHLGNPGDVSSYILIMQSVFYNIGTRYISQIYF